MAKHSNHADQVTEYYHKRESRWGYSLLLGGTKHFGFYHVGQSKWEFAKAMRAAEHELAKTLDLPRGAHLLDAGCGMGEVASNLAAWRDWHITGIDLLDFNIAEAKRRAQQRGVNDRTDFRVASYQGPDLGHEIYDGAYTMETLVHAHDPAGALAALYTALKPGGRLVSFEYSHIGYERMPAEAAAAFREINRVAAMPAFDSFAPGVHASLLEQAGFADITVTDATQRMLPMLDAFHTLARLPYAAARKLGKHEHAINAMSAVEFWNHRGCWQYTTSSPRASPNEKQRAPIELRMEIVLAAMVAFLSVAFWLDNS